MEWNTSKFEKLIIWLYDTQKCVWQYGSQATLFTCMLVAFTSCFIALRSILPLGLDLFYLYVSCVHLMLHNVTFHFASILMLRYLGVFRETFHHFLVLLGFSRNFSLNILFNLCLFSIIRWWNIEVLPVLKVLCQMLNSFQTIWIFQLKLDFFSVSIQDLKTVQLLEILTWL